MNDRPGGGLSLFLRLETATEGDGSGPWILLFDVMETAALVELNFPNPLVTSCPANGPGFLAGWGLSCGRRAELYAQLAEPPRRLSQGCGLKMPDEGIQHVRHDPHPVHSGRHKEFFRPPRGNPRVSFPPLLHQRETDLQFRFAGIAIVVQQTQLVSQDRQPGEYRCRAALFKLAPQVAGQEMRAALDFLQLKPSH